MKRVVLIALILGVVAASGFAVEFDPLSFPAPVRPGSVMIDAGAGMRYLQGWTSLDMSIPPLFVQAEYALPVGVPISVGAGVGFGQWKLDAAFWGFKVTYITPHVRGNWHWGLDIPWLDLYTGISLGMDIVSVKWNDNLDDWLGGWGFGSLRPSGPANDFYWGAQVGAHFYFTEYVGAMVETGYPFWVKAGVALKVGGKGSSNQASRGSSSSRSSGDFMLVNADSLNIRSGPGADHAVVGSAPRDASVEVLDRSGQWWRIRYESIEGYVNSSYLR